MDINQWLSHVDGLPRRNTFAWQQLINHRNSSSALQSTDQLAHLHPKPSQAALPRVPVLTVLRPLAFSCSGRQAQSVQTLSESSTCDGGERRSAVGINLIGFLYIALPALTLPLPRQPRVKAFQLRRASGSA